MIISVSRRPTYDVRTTRYGKDWSTVGVRTYTILHSQQAAEAELGDVVDR